MAETNSPMKETKKVLLLATRRPWERNRQTPLFPVLLGPKRPKNKQEMPSDFGQRNNIVAIFYHFKLHILENQCLFSLPLDLKLQCVGNKAYTFQL